jgi:hypothetical protein
VQGAWRDLQREAAAQRTSVVQLSSAMALSAVRELPENARWLSKAAQVCGRRAGEVLAGGLLDHYRKSLDEIREIGYGRYWLREFSPYLKGALQQFSASRESMTERLLRRRRAKQPSPGQSR